MSTINLENIVPESSLNLETNYSSYILNKAFNCFEAILKRQDYIERQNATIIEMLAQAADYTDIEQEEITSTLDSNRRIFSEYFNNI